MKDQPNSIRLAQEIRKFSYKAGIDLVGFSSMDEPSLYLRPENRGFMYEMGYRWAISIACRISFAACELLLRGEDAGMLFCFDRHCREQAALLERAAHSLCLHLEDNGIRAFLVPGMGKGYNDGGAKVTVSHMAQAHLAGLGEMGDSGMLITPQYGPRVRLATILVDHPLPLASKMLTGVCTHCGLCKKVCPSGSIKGERFNPSYPEQCYTDKNVCGRYRDGNKARLGSRFCNLCMAICPVGRPALKGAKPYIVTAAE